jgi:hypothetical protein
VPRVFDPATHRFAHVDALTTDASRGYSAHEEISVRRPSTKLASERRRVISYVNRFSGL